MYLSFWRVLVAVPILLLSAMPLVRYLPGAQPTHPTPAFPAGHAWHAALPASDCVPTSQDAQLVAVARREFMGERGLKHHLPIF